MLGIKYKYQKEYSLKLKSEIDGFILNFNKRLKLYPNRDINKILKFKNLKDEIIVIDKVEYTPIELVKRTNQLFLTLKSQSKSSYFNYVINGFIKESNGKDLNTTKTIYEDYSNQLKLVFKDMQLNFSFCLDSLKEINKLLKKKESEYKESEEIKNMLGFITLESSEELDLRDFYLECYNDVLFMENTEDDVYNDFSKIQADVKVQIKAYKKALKNNDFTSAKNSIRLIKKSLKGLVDIIKSIDTNDKNTLKSLIRSVNMTIASMVIVIPNSGSLASLISMLRDEKNKNDELKTEENSNKVISQAINSLKILSKVCDAMEKEVKEKEDEFKKNSKEVKEATEYEAKRLSIYESCKNGEITIDEREELLESLQNQRFISESYNNDIDVMISNREKYEIVKKDLYEKCSNGEMSIDEREELLEEAYKLIFTPVDVEEDGEPESDDGSEELVTQTAGDPAEQDNSGETNEDSEIDPEADASALDDANSKLADGLSQINIPVVNF